MGIAKAPGRSITIPTRTTIMARREEISFFRDGHVQWVKGGKNYVFNYELSQDEARTGP